MRNGNFLMLGMRQRISSPTMITANDLDLVFQIATHRTLSGAARSMRVNQSTITRRLDELESRLGVGLFVRGSRGVAPTAVAERLLPLAEEEQRAVREANALLGRTMGEPEGWVRVAALEVLVDHLLVPALPKLKSLAPRVRVEMLPSGATAKLLEREADIGVRFVRPRQKDLSAVRISELTLAAFASEPCAEDRVEALDWLTWTQDSATPDARWLEATVPQSIVFRATSARTLLAAAQTGLGVVLLPLVFGHWMGLSHVPVVDLPPMKAELWLVRTKSTRSDPAVSAVFGWIRETFDGMRVASVDR